MGSAEFFLVKEAQRIDMPPKNKIPIMYRRPRVCLFMIYQSFSMDLFVYWLDAHLKLPAAMGDMFWLQYK